MKRENIFLVVVSRLICLNRWQKRAKLDNAWSTWKYIVWGLLPGLHYSSKSVCWCGDNWSKTGLQLFNTWLEVDWRRIKGDVYILLFRTWNMLTSLMFTMDIYCMTWPHKGPIFTRSYDEMNENEWHWMRMDKSQWNIWKWSAPLREKYVLLKPFLLMLPLEGFLMRDYWCFPRGKAF